MNFRLSPRGRAILDVLASIAFIGFVCFAAFLVISGFITAMQGWGMMFMLPMF